MKTRRPVIPISALKKTSHHTIDIFSLLLSKFSKSTFSHVCFTPMEENKLLGRTSSSDDDAEDTTFASRIRRISNRETFFSRMQIFRCCLEIILIVCLLGTTGIILKNDTSKAGACNSQVWPAGSDYNHFVPHGKSLLPYELF